MDTNIEKTALKRTKRDQELFELREAYERECEKQLILTEKVATAESRVDALDGKLGRIKNSFFWRISGPFRKVFHLIVRTRDRIGRYGSLKGVLRKLDSKRIEKMARKNHGTLSFPSPERAQKEREEVFPRNIKISILMPLYNTPEKFLRQAIDSVLAQTYENWELCLADGSDAEHHYVEKVVREYIDKDAKLVEESPRLTEGRIKYKPLVANGGISANTNECLAEATGEYIGLFDHDDILHPSVLYEYMKVICEQNADYVYCDETTFSGNSIDKMITLHFKPDFAIDNLRANNYICHFSVFDRQLLEGTEVFRSEFDGSQDHDMILRLTTLAQKVVHVPKLLYYWRSHKGSVASDISAKSYAIDAAKGAVADHLRKCGFENFEIQSTKAFETIFRIKYEVLGNPKISIIIANKDHAQDLKRCISSIFERSTYDNYEIIIVENGSTTPEIFEYYESLKDNALIKVVKFDPESYPFKEEDKSGYTVAPPFNYSAVNNFGAGFATGEYIILLNNDTQVITLSWMEELLMYAQRSDVGAVGAKLYYADKTIQHAGVVIGLGVHRTAGHTHYKENYTNFGYMGRLCYAQNMSAVTGACLMVKKALFDELGGLSEAFAVSLNDVDFCLRLREKGYLNVFTPFAEMYHFESVSRGLDDNGDKARRYDEESTKFREKWAEMLEKGDPYYNPNFSLDRSDFALKTEGM